LFGRAESNQNFRSERQGRGYRQEHPSTPQGRCALPGSPAIEGKFDREVDGYPWIVYRPSCVQANDPSFERVPSWSTNVKYMHQSGRKGSGETGTPGKNITVRKNAPPQLVIPLYIATLCNTSGHDMPCRVPQRRVSFCLPPRMRPGFLSRCRQAFLGSTAPAVGLRNHQWGGVFLADKLETGGELKNAG
jgi:hypothetical protein